MDVHCTGRTYRFDQVPFPSAIRTAGQSVLAAPVTVHVVANGREQLWAGTKLEVTKETPARVELFQLAVSADMDLSAHTEILYDGTIRIDWELRPRGALPTSVEQVIFEIRLRSDYAKYTYYYPDDSASWSSHRPGDLEHVGGHDLPFMQGFNPVLGLGMRLGA